MALFGVMSSRLAGAGRTVALAAVLIGCGDGEADKIRDAHSRYVEAFDERDVHTVCRSLLPHTMLPKAIAQRAGFAGGGTPSNGAEWDRSVEDCDAQFGKRGEFDTSKPDRPDYSDWRIEVVDVDAANEIDAIAFVRPDSGSRAEKASFARFRGQWRQIFEIN